jgi:glucan phosphoethanolaminetransferase (alkaline phosphatase superfamily)
MFSRFLFAISRALIVSFFLLTSIYCLLAWIPFTYQQVVKGGLLPALTVFVKWHPQIYWTMLALAAATLLPDVRRRKTRWLAATFLAAHGAGGFWLQGHPLLAGLHNELRSFYWSLITLGPLLWLAAIDWAGQWNGIEWAEFRRAEDRRIFQATWQSALFLSVVYAGVFQLRSTVPIGTNGGLVALASTLLSHLTILFGIFAGVNLLRSVASLTPRPSPVEFVLCNIFTGGVVWAVIRVLVFKPVSFDGQLAVLSATALSAGIMATISGFSLRFWSNEQRGPASGLALAVMPFSLGRFRSDAGQMMKLAAIAGLACVLAVNTAVMDWNYLVQKLTVLLIWTLTFSSIYVWRRATPLAADDTSTGRGRMLAIVVLAMIGYRSTASAMEPRPQLGAALESYAGFDVSFRIIRDMLSPPPRDNSFYSFLRASTNIPRSVQVSPVNVEMAASLAAKGTPQPNIFVFVVDSLRRDYLSTYNSSVDFTPNLDAFARESAVFRNAFTHYGGTGLSEPSIWVGGMILHKQYVTPFYPMNTLEKLIRAEKYQPFVSMDTILNTAVEPMPNLIELDHNKLNMDFDFCGTVGELESKIGDYHGAAPIFMYTQPQNIHISVIQRQGAKSIDDGNYRGFYAPYASRLRRIDGCFGQFVNFLKTRGMYDNSVVVFTADHGDSLGEQGRWGHAYSLAPEIVRIPLLIHLPASLRQLHYDPSGVAFSTDLTPSLYYILGHSPSLHNEIFGKPLFTETAEEQAMWHRDHYMIAASYAAVYGILSGEGKSLFVADGVNEQDSYWEMDDRTGRSGFAGSRAQEQGQKLIREGITRINELYKFRPGVQ